MADHCVRVLIAVPQLVERGDDDPLRELAKLTYGALAEGADPRLSLDFDKNLSLPPRFHVDPSFGVLPGGSINDDVSFENMSPEKTELFILAGYFEFAANERISPVLRVEGRGDVTVMLDLEVSAHLTCGTSRFKGNADDVRAKLDLQTLRSYGLDGTGVAVALIDTGIQLAYLAKKLNDEQYSSYPHVGKPPITINTDEACSWPPPRLASRPFQHCLDHGTMTAYDVLIAAPNATLLDYPMLSARAPGDHTVRGTIRAVMTAYHHIAVRWIYYASLPKPLPKPPYRALVVNNSWGIYNPALDFPPGNPGRYIDNPNHHFRRIVKLLNNHNFDIVFSAGNCGSDCPAPPCLGCITGTINGASAYPEVLTVAGCDIDDNRVGYSSQGPAIAGMPEREKPDVTAYTHFLGSAVWARWLPDAGTSASGPVTSGCIAALRTKVDPTVPGKSPADMFAAFRNTAQPRPGPAGWNPDYGFGIINPVAVGQYFCVIP
jgi:hypothetical protein